MKIAWLGLLAFGFASVLTTSACEVSTGGTGGLDDEGGRGATGGTSGGKTSGGSSSGGSSMGGSSSGGSSSGGSSSGGSSSGGTATGGSSGEGGDSFNPMCDDKKNPGFPETTCDVPEAGSDANVACLKCLKKNADCCTALKNCYATDPDNECGYGGKTLGQTEYLCFQDCLLEKIMTNGTYTDDDQDTCAADCSPSCAGVPSDATNEVITCMHDSCEDECFPQ